MTLSCLIGKLSSPVLRSKVTAQYFQKLKNGPICVLQQSYHCQVGQGEKRSKLACIPCHYNLQESGVNKFSTTTSSLAQHKNHDHSKMWTLERFLAASLLPLVPAALLNPCQQLDTVLALAIVLHVHFGLEAVVVDYIRPILFGELAPKIGLGLLYLLSIVTLAGLLNLIYNDTGLANTILTVWKK